MELIGNYTQARYSINKEEKKEKELESKRINNSVISAQKETGETYTIDVISDKMTGNDIIRLQNIREVRAITRNDLIVTTMGMDETINFYHYQVSTKGATMINSFENISRIESHEGDKIWFLASELKGLTIYNAKAKKAWNSKRMLQKNTVCDATIGTDSYGEFTQIELGFDYVVGNASDSVIVTIDPDGLDILSTRSKNRPIDLIYPYATVESKNSMNQLASPEFPGFLEENYGKLLELQNKIREYAEKLGNSDDVRAMEISTSDILKLVYDQKKLK